MFSGGDGVSFAPGRQLMTSRRAWEASSSARVRRRFWLSSEECEGAGFSSATGTGPPESKVQFPESS